MTLIEIFIIPIVHWIADFWLQTDKQAKGKSKNWEDLLTHVWTYSMCWLIVGAFIQAFNHGVFFPKWAVTQFMLITFICHTITDYFTSRLNSKLWEQGKVHYFFIAIGGDQILHYIQLFLTYKLLRL